MFTIILSILLTSTPQTPQQHPRVEWVLTHVAALPDCQADQATNCARREGGDKWEASFRVGHSTYYAKSRHGRVSLDAAYVD